MKMMKVRIRETGQVTEMIPHVARAMILGGTAEEVKAQPETMAVAPASERAVTSAQNPSRKPVLSRRRVG